MGTKEECNLASKFYNKLAEDKTQIKSLQISNLYANRGSNTIFRLYIDIEYYDRIIYELQN